MNYTPNTPNTGRPGARAPGRPEAYTRTHSRRASARKKTSYHEVTPKGTRKIHRNTDEDIPLPDQKLDSSSSLILKGSVTPLELSSLGWDAQRPTGSTTTKADIGTASVVLPRRRSRSQESFERRIVRGSATRQARYDRDFDSTSTPPNSRLNRTQGSGEMLPQLKHQHQRGQRRRGSRIHAQSIQPDEFPGLWGTGGGSNNGSDPNLRRPRGPESMFFPPVAEGGGGSGDLGGDVRNRQQNVDTCATAETWSGSGAQSSAGPPPVVEVDEGSRPNRTGLVKDRESMVATTSRPRDGLTPLDLEPRQAHATWDSNPGTYTRDFNRKYDEGSQYYVGNARDIQTAMEVERSRLEEVSQLEKALNSLSIKIYILFGMLSFFWLVGGIISCMTSSWWFGLGQFGLFLFICLIGIYGFQTLSETILHSQLNLLPLVALVTLISMIGSLVEHGGRANTLELISFACGLAAIVTHGFFTWAASVACGIISRRHEILFLHQLLKHPLALSQLAEAASKKTREAAGQLAVTPNEEASTNASTLKLQSTNEFLTFCL